MKDAKLELQSADSVLKENDQIREKIEEEMREKGKIEMEKMLNIERAKLDEERQKVSQDVRGELKTEMDEMNNRARNANMGTVISTYMQQRE